MKKHSVLVLSLLTAIVGCGSSNDNPTPAGSAGSAGHAGTVASAGAGAAAGAGPGAGAGGMAATAGSAGTATSGSAGTAAGSGGTCEIPSLEVFSRSDTDAGWDDNDFSDVMLGADPCPKLVDVTWPHEMGWQNADPSDANHEVTHFTLDSYSSVDLSNKKLSLTIELANDQRGPAATAGSYSISLVSVSTFDRVVTPPAAGGADAGGASGSGGSAGSSGSAGSGGASGGGGDSSGGTGGALVTTETGYTEAEAPVADRATLRFVGDRATVTFALPNKTTEVGSYDPTRAIKINIRIYNTFSNGQTTGTGGAGAGGSAGTGGSAGMSGSAGAAGKAGSGGFAGIGGSIGGSGGTGGSIGGSGGSGGSSGGSGGSGTAPTYDYVKSQFSIKSFVIKDASAP